MDDKQLLAQFAAAALTGLLNYYGNEGGEAAAKHSLNIAEAMLAEFKQRELRIMEKQFSKQEIYVMERIIDFAHTEKQRTEQKENGNG